MNNVKCPICGSISSKIIYDVSNPKVYKNIRLPGIVRQCNNCTLIYKAFNEAAESLYNDDYASGFLELREYSENANNLFNKLINNSFKRIENKQIKPELLDIGSGIGVLLETAKKIGYSVTGVEISPRLAEYAKRKGYNIINKNVSEISSKIKFDTITMMDIIEHLTNPKDVLIKLKVLLKPEGELIIYTPNHNSLIIKISDFFYRLGIKSPIENIFACTHTCFFTTETLCKILIQSGFQIYEVRHFNYDTSRPGQKVTLITKVAINIIEKLGSLLGFNGFRVVVYAKPLN